MSIADHPFAIAAAAGIGVAGLGYTLMGLGEGVTTLETQHWLMLLVILVVGYTLGRLWTTPAQMVGLP
jgi:hypothetical protein